MHDLTFEQLSEYDVGRFRPGSTYAAGFPDQGAADGARIPSLAEVLAVTRHVPLLIEMKTSPAEPELTVAPVEMAELVIDALTIAEAVPRNMILSFDWRGLRHLRREHSEVATGWLTQRMSDVERHLWWGEEPRSRRGLSAVQVIADQGGPCWLPEFGEMRQRADVTAARQLGLQVIPWAVERPDEMNCAIEWGVEGLITDRPDLALKILDGWKRSESPGVS